jgi:hypothetical protein
LGVGGIHLELVIGELVVGRFEEQLEYVVEPRRAVVALDIGVEVGVFHFRREVEVVVVIEQSRFGRRLGFSPLPMDVEGGDFLRVFPGFLVSDSVDLDRPLRPPALRRPT